MATILTNRKCKFCAREFIKPKNISQKNWMIRCIFCSKLCYWKSLIGKKHTEEQKRKIGLASLGRKKTIKQRKQMSGSNNWNWKGGKSREYKTGYYSYNYKLWRKNVFERDGYKCIKCGFEGKNGFITAHHIKSFSLYPHLRFEINNGITLCEKCHCQTDNYKGRAKRKENRGYNY